MERLDNSPHKAAVCSHERVNKMERASIALKGIEVDALVDFFTHYMDMDTRTLLASNYPVIYSKLFSNNPVKVVRVMDLHTIGDNYAEMENK